MATQTKGLIHVYTGDGKGKTTASAGLALRAASKNKKVVFAQFLKNGSSGEIAGLRKIGARVVVCEDKFGFTFNMSDDTRRRCGDAQCDLLCEAVKIACGEEADLLVLDEALDAIAHKLLDEQKLRDFLASKPESLEVVLTGRPVPLWLFEIADYLTDMAKIKHPFEQGVHSRDGIEY